MSKLPGAASAPLLVVVALCLGTTRLAADLPGNSLEQPLSAEQAASGIGFCAIVSGKLVGGIKPRNAIVDE